MIGDRDAIAGVYMYGAVFLLGAIFGLLVLAERASSMAAGRRRDERRQHAEEVALLDARADRHETDLRALIDAMPPLLERINKLEQPKPRRASPSA